MKIAIISDTHWSARKASKNFHEYFQLFYDNVFFPTLEEHGIKTVVHMGDAFDNRKNIDFWGLDWTRRVVLEPLRKYEVHMIVGNHDIYLRNSTKINAPSLLLQNYSNIKTYSDPEVIKIGNLNVLLIPWICADNEEKTLRLIKKSGCKVAMGHLELNGFQAYRGHTMDDGMDSIMFDDFTKVFSGHYHTRSNNGTVFYLGNPYEIFWNDVNDTRGFHIFDTETLEHTPVNNPYKMYYVIYYDDDNYQTFDTREYENKIVKVIVRKKSNTKKFEKFIDKLYTSNISELKIVENLQIEENEEFEAYESEDTLSILNRYVEESEISLDKSIVQKMLHEIYREACEIV
jgi:DNA repair exonuclease SbcCD nuclease subunit